MLHRKLALLHSLIETETSAKLLRPLVLIEKKSIAELNPGAIQTPVTFGVLSSSSQTANARIKLVERRHSETWPRYLLLRQARSKP